MLLSLFGGAFAAADHHFPPALCRAHISMRRIVAQFYRALPSLCVSLCAFCYHLAVWLTTTATLLLFFPCQLHCE